MIFDLHTHTDCSDGELAPQALVAAARAAGVDVLAITDHDTLAAFDVCPPGESDGLRLIGGIELSVRWRRMSIHVVGLNVDPRCDVLIEGAAIQAGAREERASRIAKRLDKLGLGDTLTGAAREADGRQIGRPHFARHLVREGKVKDFRDAFKRYLGNGKAGDVKGEWVDLPTAIEWIHAAGGRAVLAHPAKYKLTRTRLGELTTDFTEASGDALEVISGSQTPDVTSHLAAICKKFGLLASAGSDFHGESSSWAKLGQCGPLPASCRPVWEAW